MDLKPYVPLEYCSNVCTAVDISTGNSPASRVAEEMASQGAYVATGMGSLREKVIRIATMGTIRKSDVSATLNALKRVLR